MYKLQPGASPYYSHQPVLAGYVERTRGPVLELGCGDGSTPMLHALCEPAGRLLISVEADAAWASRFAPLQTPTHELHVPRGWDDPEFMDSVPHLPWSVAFVDQGSWDSRVRAVAALADTADFLVLHDSDYYTVPSHNISWIVKADGKPVYDFKYWKEYRPPASVGGTPTVVCSNRLPCDLAVDWQRRSC